MPINVNTTNKEELKQIPGVGEKIANQILQFREVYGVVKKEVAEHFKIYQIFWHYLLGRVFKVRTYHSSSTWLLKFRDPQGQLARWMEELSQYHMVVQFRQVVKHGNVDALSRRPDRLLSM